MEYEFGGRRTIGAGFICRPVPETPGVIIRIIVVIPRKASLLSARSDRENRLVRTAVRVRLLRAMVRSGSHLHEESITQIPHAARARSSAAFLFPSGPAFNCLFLQIDTG